MRRGASIPTPLPRCDRRPPACRHRRSALLLGLRGTFDAIDRFCQHRTAERRRPSKDDDPDPVLLAPHDLLAVWNRLSVQERVLERLLRNTICTQAILRMSTDGDIAEARHARKVVIH